MTKSKCYGAGISGYGGMTPLGSTKIDYYCGGCGKPCELVSATDTKPETDEGTLSRRELIKKWMDAKLEIIKLQEQTAQREEAAARWAWEASKDAWDEADDGDGRIDRWQGESFEDAWKKRRREREKFNRISDPHALIYLEDDEPLVLSELVEYWKGLSKREETAARDALTLLCETYTDIADRFNPNAVEDFVAKWKQRRFNK